MLTHMLHEWRTPWCQRDRINQGQAAVIPAVEQMCAQHGGAAEVVGDDVRALQIPVIEQLRQQVILHTEGDIGVRLLGAPVAQQIEVMHPMRGEKVRCDPMPHV
ncbi:hypothetical protein D3C87_1580490 [compost metagenome]